MNVFAKHVVLSAAGMLILPPAVIAFAQVTVPSPAAASGSAPSTGRIAAGESSQNQDPPGKAGSSSGAITQPGRAGGKGDPAFGGERHRFIGSQNLTP